MKAPGPYETGSFTLKWGARGVVDRVAMARPN